MSFSNNCLPKIQSGRFCPHDFLDEEAGMPKRNITDTSKTERSRQNSSHANTLKQRIKYDFTQTRCLLIPDI